MTEVQDLATLQAVKRSAPGLRVFLLLDSVSQLAELESFAPSEPFDVLLEIGVMGARTGVLTLDETRQLAQAARASTAVRLCGVECFEGLGVSGDDDRDRKYWGNLIEILHGVVRYCEKRDLLEDSEILIPAGARLFSTWSPQGSSPQRSERCGASSARVATSRTMTGCMPSPVRS